MLIITGHLDVDPARRDEYVSAFAEFVARARNAPGCLDLAVTADSVDPGRIHNYERWASVADVRAFREHADPPDTGIDILDADVRLHDASGERDPFDLEPPRSGVRGVLAQATVSDLDVAEKWYSTLFGRAPDARPMAGLLTWHLLSPETGVQVWAEPERAGRSSMVLGVDDIDGLAERLRAAGVDHDGPQQVTASRLLPLQDPDGNLVVFSGQ